MRKNIFKISLGLIAFAAFWGLSEPLTMTVKAAESDERIYCVGSVSKVYVTAAVMKLVDEGKVELDESVTTYLPAFTMADERYKDITVRMLMNHTSGIMGSTQIGMFLFDDNATAHHDRLLDVLATQRLKAAPGEYAAYCNDGFDLLELIVESVSGMSYTDYVEKNIALPLGASNTGSAKSLYGSKLIAPNYDSSNMHHKDEYTLAIGAGGIMATASDAAAFGASFFKGDTTLLTEKSKSLMATRWKEGEYIDGCGLGWDYVEELKYEKEGVKVLGKGGDTGSNHASLLVAPDEKISISVLSIGGSSSYNQLVAEAILDEVLNERGIEVKEPETEVYETVNEIPSSFDEFAGMYVSNNALECGVSVCNITFPEHKYMHVESISPFKTTETDYLLTKDNRFVELAFEIEEGKVDEARISANPALIEFVKSEDGQVYFGAEFKQVIPGLGSIERKTFTGERMEGNPVNMDILASWASVSMKDFLLYTDINSSMDYEMPTVNLVMNEALPGYVFAITGRGSRLLKIVDKESAVSFQTIPSSSNRDLIDIKLSAGELGPELISSSGNRYVLEDSIPVFDGDTKEIKLDTYNASWFAIDDSLGNTSVSMEKPDNATINVFNKYGEIVYTTDVADASNDIPLPKGGRILFLGKTGGSITIN